MLQHMLVAFSIVTASTGLIDAVVTRQQCGSTFDAASSAAYAGLSSSSQLRASLPHAAFLGSVKSFCAG
jgi:hypothetical protein